MKAITLLVAILGGMGTAASTRAAEAVSPDIFQTSVNATFAAGSNFGGDVLLVTTPASKRLVIQSISFYTSGGAAGSSAKLFLQTSIFNTTSFWAVPEAVNDGSPFPSTTMSATFYAGGGTSVYVDSYRTGDLTNSETLVVSVSGYYVEKP